MRDAEKKFRRLQYQLCQFNQKDSPCNGIDNVSIIVHKKKIKSRKKYDLFKYGQQPVTVRLSRYGSSKTQKRLTRHTSMPEINKRTKSVQQRTRSNNAIVKKNNFINSKFTISRISEHRFNHYLSPFIYPTQKKWKVYRCQLGAVEDSCCCSCNSDAMFEVMKGLYDCYKKKNCDNCNCVLCGHLPREERRLGEVRKSLASVGLAGEKERKAKIKKTEKSLRGKTKEEKEKIFEDLAKAGQPLPEGKTASEKALIRKIRTDLGLPPEPKTASEKLKMVEAEAAGVLIPLEGKTPSQKEQILKAQAKMGVPLPEGRTASEKALIKKIKIAAGIPEGIPSEKIRKAKEKGLITPLAGKSPEDKEKILRGLAMEGLPLPEGKTASEKQLNDKVRGELGLPPEPKTKSMKEKYAKAANAGLMQPLEGKSTKEKEKILQGLADMGIPLPEGRTASEKALIAKVKAKAEAPPEVVAPSEKIRKAKVAGLLTPLEDKTPEQKEKILKGLAMQGFPLPEPKTKSDIKLAEKVRADLGLPAEPKTPSMREKYDQAAKAGILQPLEGKTHAEKDKILQGLHDKGIPLPEGRTPSEKSLIAKIKAGARPPSTPSEKLRKAKATGLLTPLDGKTPEQKEKIYKGLAMQGIPLPEGKTASERKLIDKVRADLGLPPEPKTPSMKDKYTKAANAGLLQPLEGKSPKEKEKILQGLHDMGIPLPEGRTASEKSLIAKVKAGPHKPTVLAPSEKTRRAKAAEVLPPLEGKTPAEKEKILKGQAMQGIPLPEGKTASEKKLIDKVRADLGLPPEPKTPSMRQKYNAAADAGLLQPLEGKSPKEKERILKGLHEMGIPLPEGRTTSEKALIANIKAPAREPPVLPPSEKLQKAKAAGLLTPLEGKTPEQKEKVLKGLAMQGIPLPQGKTTSEKKLVDKVRAELGLPPEPKSPSMREKYNKAAEAGFLQPLEGKSAKEKEKILQGLQDMGIPLPEGRTASEKAIIAKVKAGPRAPTVIAPSEKMRKAKAAGLLTPIEGKTPAEKEKILRGLAMQGIPLPEGKTASERKLIDKVREDLGLPPEAKTPSMKEKYSKAAEAGLLQPLEGKTPQEKDKQLQALHDMGIPLPKGRTASEKSLIARIKAGIRPPVPKEASEKIQKAKAAGLLTPIEGKTPEQQEKILRGLAMQGIPLPEGKTASQKKLGDKVRVDLGLPPEPKTPSMKDRYKRAADAGLLQPLEGKSAKEKERILQGLHDMGIPLPEGRTASEKALINKVKAGPRAPTVLVPSEKLRKAKAAGLLTPLQDKTPAQREKLLRGLAMQGVPLPVAKSPSEQMIIDKVRADLGLPPEPKTPSIKDKHAKAAEAGLLQPLEGKSAKEKERILKGLHEMGIPLPEGRTASEKALIAKVKAEPHAPSKILAPSEKLRKVKAAGLLTPLEGKTPSQKEKILRGLAMHGMPLPEGKTASEKKLINKVRADVGLPPEPKTAAEKEMYNKAAAAGLITPLEGKSPEEKKRILKGQHDLGLPLPEGRTVSEKALIRQIKAGERRKTKAIGVGAPALPPEERRKLDEKTAKKVKEGKGPVDECICGLLTPDSERESLKPAKLPSEKIRAAKEAGILTPLEKKTPEQKEKILRGLVKQGLPLPEAKTASEKKLIDKVRADLGLPPEPKTLSMKEKYTKAQEKGLLSPLEGKTASQKEKILRGQAEAGLPLPEGRTASEKALIAKIKTTTAPSITTEKLRKAKAAGLLTPLEGKTPEEKEKILKGLAKTALPLPEGRTASEKAMIKKIKTELGVPERTPSEKIRKAKVAGILTPLEGKTHSQKEKILRGRAAAGLPLPVGRTPSERALIQKIKEDTGYVTPSPSEKMRKAKAAGLLTPIEGKTPSQKEKILKQRVAAGIPIPEGKTPSEKEIIRKITAGEPPAVKRPTEKLKEAKVGGLISPLEGKTADEKEKKLRGLIKAGLPLPEPKTASERNLMDKIRRDVGLPPEPKTASLKERYKKAQDAGIIAPLEGKTPAEKEKILKRLHEAGIPLPEGRTPSEKSIIKRIKAGLPERKTPSEKIKAAGLLTPLKGKSPTEKEKILKGLVKSGKPLPEGKTASEKQLIKKIRADIGLPPEPVTVSVKEKMEKAQAAGIITPLEGKTPSQKAKILKGLADAGVPLPEGRTASEKELVAKVKAESKPPTKITSEKLQKAKAAGLLTPLTGKSPKEKERILKGLVEQGLPLPEARTESEKKVAAKVRKELGLPHEPERASERERLRKAQAAGIVTPLQGKTPSQKERVIRGIIESGIAPPEGRTTSEKAMIKKVQAEVAKPMAGPPALPHAEREKLEKKTAKVIKEGKGPSDECICGLLTPESERGKPLSKIPSEKIQKPKDAGLLTPLKGKTASEKEKIMKDLAIKGLPLPEPKTISEKKLTDKVRKDLGLPPEPKTPSMKEKHAKAAAAKVPLEGLPPAEKEKILKAQADMGIPLPEGRTPSEKALITKVKAEAKGIPTKIPSEKIRKAKAAGLLTPLEGKTASQKEKIMRDLAKQGLPLPETKTPSEKKIADKVRRELALPPEPVTASLKKKHEKAAAAGILVPLEGLTPVEKEKILKAQAEMGVPLPEGRTPSEKALITKVKEEAKAAPTKVPSEKIRKAKAAGLLTPLKGKTASQKEKIMRDLATQGLPLPETKTQSEKKIADKVRKELGLPPEPETASIKKKHEKAAAAGVLVPLEGLTPSEKEKILKTQADMGVPLPEGRTPSEKALITKVKEEAKAAPTKIPSEKIRKAKAAGLLTPLKGKTASQKEKVMRDLAQQGLPLPETITPSEKKVADKVRKELGLPPEPETASIKKKHEKAAAAGILVPLEGLTPSEKEKILKAQADMGVPLPEGRTPSEKALITKVKEEAKAAPMKIPSEKIRKAKAAGLLTPLKGKTASQKEKVMRDLAQQGLPLPETKTPSEKKVADKVRKELGLPPEPETASIKKKHEKAAAAGILVPLEGLTPAEKEKILKAQADMGVPLPEGRTPSEKALITKVKEEAKAAPMKIPSEKIRKAKAAGLLTPLKGKTASQKEKVMRDLAQQGLPLPETKTPSEKKVADKVRKELGLPPEPETASIKKKHEKAAAAGILVPLEGLTPAEKEKILKAQADMGVPLPEGRTPSEKALITKVKAEAKAAPTKVPSEKIRKAKAAGLLTPLEGKTASQKEKIMRDLAKQGLPLPETKTPSEKRIADKVRKELGLPPEPETDSMKKKYEKAAAAGVLVPLDGLSPEEKKKVLRDQANLGIPLPEGRTASEKALIAKIKAEQEPPKVTSEKMRKAKAAGLITPLEGKTKSQKEKILKGLAEAGMPLPEGKTASEIALAQKIRAEMGIPPPAKTASEKSVVRKAKAEGLLTPIAGKPAKEKERILKGLADAGLPLPEGKTASEKELIQKVRTATGLPPEPTPSEKRGEIKTKSKKVGITPSKKIVKAAGIREEYEDIIKTTTCDRGCGCDKKKIRFKHSYVKIRVTSPDISSLCPCPNECIPGVKAGAFIDNEGIKVTVGRVDGVTSYTNQFSNHILETPKNIITIFDNILTDSSISSTSIDTVDASFDNTFATCDLKQTLYDACISYPNNEDNLNSNLNTSLMCTSGSYDSNASCKTYRIKSESFTDESQGPVDTFRYPKPIQDVCRSPAIIYSTSNECAIMAESSRGSFDSILVIKSESSLSLTTDSNESMDVISVISFSNSSYYASSSTHYIYCPVSNDNFSDNTVEEAERFTNVIDYSGNDDSTDDTIIMRSYKRNRDQGRVYTGRPQNEYFTYRLSKTRLDNEHNSKQTETSNGQPVIVINNLDSEHDITTMVDEILSKEDFSGASSIFVIVPTSDDNDSDLTSESVSSTVCIQLSEHYANWNQHQHDSPEPETANRRNSHGLKISAKGKKFCLEGLNESMTSYHNKETMFNHNLPTSCGKKTKDNDRTIHKLCQITTPSDFVNNPGVSTDTTADRPCCCVPNTLIHSPEPKCVANVVSELVTPLLVNQGLDCDEYRHFTKMNAQRQPSFASISRVPTSVTPCEIPPCSGHIDCHRRAKSTRNPNYPDTDTVFSPNPPSKSPTSELGSGLQQTQPCQCDTEKLQKMIEQVINAGKKSNLKTTGCGGGAVPDEQPSNQQQVSQPLPIIQPQPNAIGKNQDCDTCAHPKYKDGIKMQCTCSGKKRTIRMRPLCPCEQHQPQISKTTAGPKEGTISLGCQCCICEESTLKGCPGFKKGATGPGMVNVLGPAGGLSQCEPGGTYTQAGLYQAQAGTSTDTLPKDCVCKSKRGKKKKNIICECPPTEPEPVPKQEPPMDQNDQLEQYGAYQWLDEKQVLRQRSDMTQTQSGFRFFKKKKPPPLPQEEFTIEDAVRYYAIMNPEILRDLVPPPQPPSDEKQSHDDAQSKDCACEDDKRKKKRKVDCACPYEPPPPMPPDSDAKGGAAGVGAAGASAAGTGADGTGSAPEGEQMKEEDEGPFGGFKFSMGGKGSGSKGLSGICCFDMIQETHTSRTHYTDQ